MLQNGWARESDFLQNDPRNWAYIGLEASHFIGEISTGIYIYIYTNTFQVPKKNVLSNSLCTLTIFRAIWRVARYLHSIDTDMCRSCQLYYGAYEAQAE